MNDVASSVDLYASTFFESARWHATRLDELGKLQEKLPHHQTDMLYHAGGAIEMLIDGLVVKDPINLWLLKKNESGQKLDQLKANQLDILCLSKTPTKKVGLLRPIAMRQCFPARENELRQKIENLMERITDARNDVVHRGISEEDAEDIYAMYMIVRDTIGRISGYSSEAYLALCPYDDCGPSADTAWRQLLNLWIETRRNAQAWGSEQSSDLQSACAAKMCELAEQFVEQYHPRTGRHTWLNMQLCSCPCCGGAAIYVCKYVNPVTFWVREANNGPSAFHMQDLKKCGMYFLRIAMEKLSHFPIWGGKIESSRFVGNDKQCSG